MKLHYAAPCASTQPVQTNSWCLHHFAAAVHILAAALPTGSVSLYPIARQMASLFRKIHGFNSPRGLGRAPRGRSRGESAVSAAFPAPGKLIFPMSIVFYPSFFGTLFCLAAGGAPRARSVQSIRAAIFVSPPPRARRPFFDGFPPAARAAGGGAPGGAGGPFALASY